MVRLVEDMQAGGHAGEPVLVLSNDPDAGGLAKAEARGVATAVVDHRPFKGDRAAFEAALQEALDKVQPDIICLAGFMRVLTEGFVAPWRGRCSIFILLFCQIQRLHTHQRALRPGIRNMAALCIL